MTGVIVDKAVYVGGVRRACGDLSDELDRLRGKTGDGSFIWIGVKDPTDAEFAQLNSELHLHPLAVEDAVNGNQRGKIEAYEGSVFVVMKTLRYIDQTSDIETGEVMLFVGDHFVLTVRRGEGNALARVRQDLEQDPEQLRHGPMAVLHAVMDSVVDTYLAVDREVLVDLEEIETAVFTDAATVDANVIYRLKREVPEFRRASSAMYDAIRWFMERGRGAQLEDGLRHHFRDVADHLRQVNDHVDTYDRLLTDVLSAHLAGVSVQQNSDMRKISAWVAIAAVPTMIAGIYGMNFEFMPELGMSVDIAGQEFRYGYFLVVGVMVTACVVLWRMFKKSGWL